MRDAYWLRNMNQADMCLLDIFGVKLKHLHARHASSQPPQTQMQSLLQLQMSSGSLHCYHISAFAQLLDA